MEILGHRIQEAVEIGRWKGMELTRNSTKLSHLFFADNLVLFGEAMEKQAILMEQIVQDFYEISG